MKNLLLLCCLFLSIASLAQNKYASDNKKAVKYYEEARIFLKRTQFYEAIEPLNKAIAKDPDFIEAWNAIGTAYIKTSNRNKGIAAYEKSISLAPDYPRSLSIYFKLGELHYKDAQYQKAIDYLNKYVEKKPKSKKTLKAAERQITNSRFALTAMETPYIYNQKPLADYANYLKLQYFPVLTVDEQTLIFTGRKGLRPRNDEDIYISRKDTLGNWSIPSSISNNINTPLNEGACTISADGRTLIFTACTGRKGYGSCDLFISYKIAETWTSPENMGETINSTSWDVQPSLSADGRELYFVSTRKGGVGGKDIWKSEKNKKGKWQTPINLGSEINTPYDEISPFIHVNGEALFFSSKGHLGLGGYDIFKSEMITDSTWKTPQNLGYPLNDNNDQVSLYISSNGKKGYYTVEKRTVNDWDSWLYGFDVPDELSINKQSIYFTGTIRDADSNKPLTAEVRLYDLQTSDVKFKTNSEKSNGEFTIVLTEGNEYGMYVSKKGYLFQDFSFSFDNISDFNKNLFDISLTPIRNGVNMVLDNLYFEFDKYDIKPESYSELETLLNFLRENKSTAIEIQGYTDNVGSTAYNLELSTKRAEMVYNYLIEKGVPKSRLKFRGFGSTNPIFPNTDEKSREKNRRIEFQIAQQR